MKQLEVQIMGQSYLLGAPEGGESKLLEAVERVDTAMCKIRDAGKVRARERIAVLAALNLAFELSAQSAGASSLAQALSVAPNGSETAAASPGDHQVASQMASLLARLDSALGDDGRLI